jgi:predicted ATPase/class 3 adenylate cyclase
MDILEVLEQVRELVQQKGRITYRILKRQFALDDEALEDLKAELLFSHPEISEVEGQGLVWNGAGQPSSSPSNGQAQTRPPASYTPPHLAERILAEQAAMEARGNANGERKIITALFADLKGSTALIEGLDPEEARTVIDPALQLMMDAVHQYDGFVAQALGDGIFALFGAPLAHEDHPQRALYAALRMQDTMRRYADTLRQQGYPPLLMRVGLNTGEVVLRSIRKDDLHADYVPVGHSTNLAARMEQLANPGSIVVSAYTHRLTDGYFAFKDLGPTQIKGVEEPLNIYEALGVGQLRTRLQVSASRYGLTRFVGRHSEMEQLKRALEQAKAGHGQIIGTMGEPGLGKSRLFYEFKLLSLGGYLVLEAYSVSHGKATAYLPVIELLKSYFRIESPDDERTRQEKVTGKVLRLDRSLEDTLPYLFALLGIEEQPSPLAQMDAQIRRRRTFEALKKLFLRESLNQPLVLIFEDLHWIDGETQGFLDVLSESLASAKILLLTNYRPEYRHEWGQKTYYTQLRLAPLGKAEAEEFLDVLLGAPSSPQPSPLGGEGASPLPNGERARERVTDNNLHALKQLILDKTQGTPFFMEEIVQELREQGVFTVGATGRSPLPTDLHIPTTVQGVLAARIDRLAPDEKALLQQLSVIGRQFPVSLIRQVITQPETELYRLLSSLQHKEFLYEQPAFPESEYIFKHALTQEVAYGTVLQEQRKALHEKTAQALEVLYKANLEEHYSDLAHHYSRSGNAAKAVEYLGLAGQQAARQSAHADAITHLTTALDLLKTLPDTPERARQELNLQLALGPTIMTRAGFSAQRVEDIYIRARALCEQLGETRQLFPVLMGLRFVYTTRGRLRVARDLGKEILRIAQGSQDPALLVEAHRGLGSLFSLRGELLTARAHLEQGLAYYDLQQHRTHAFVYGVDPAMVCLSYLGWTLWCLGYPEQALKRCEEAISHAQQLSHPHSLVFALSCTASLRQYRRESQAGQKLAEQIISLSTEEGFSHWLALGAIIRGWALAEQGQKESILPQMHQALTAYRTMGTEMILPYHFSLAAEVQRHLGQIEDGLQTVAEALALTNKTEERWYEAELHRLKGELALCTGEEANLPDSTSQILNPESEAEECFLRAIAIAQKQQAKSLELRAVMSLARLWQRQGKTAEARQRLAEIYGWFTEGFDTKDLQEAKGLLEELS